MRSVDRCEASSAAAWACESTITRGVGYNASRSALHDNCEPWFDNSSSGFRDAVFCHHHFLGTDAPANRRRDREGLWSRFVGANRGDPLYLECNVPWCECFPFVGLGAQDREGFL